MKRDAIESLTTIRELCNKRIDETPPGSMPHEGSVSTDKNWNLICRIEWICRHALEDYSSPCTWVNEFGSKCPNEATTMWTWTWSPTDKQCFCEEHTKQCKEIFMTEYEDASEGEAALLDCCKIVKLQ